ncbi:hypothetical protein BDY24DRAFT_439705 [Mrakia frigida]|uniref:Pac2p n=1 Tax=Mrakia frigida TaxID=29902 RepID=UPI003FCBF103
MVAPLHSLSINSRILVGTDRCTIRYRGSVLGTSGEWMGVEWDDPSRGKHNGEKEGVRYFDCRLANSGSFIRPSSPKIVLRKPFLATLKDRYVATTAENTPLEHESVILGRSGIEVEAPNLAKVRKRLAKLRELREIGVDDEGVGGMGEGEGEEMKQMGEWKTRGLNLSSSLIPSWEVVALIVQHLEKLDSLILTSNRFSPLKIPTLLPFLKNLSHLSLNDTLIGWKEMLLLEPSIPNLSSLELSSNHLTSLYIDPVSTASSPFPKLVDLRLDFNSFGSWDQLLPLATLSSLRTLSLSYNSLPALPPSIACFPPTLETLHLANNRIPNWESMDVLAEKATGLIGLTVRGNGFVDATPRALVRLGLIARFGELKVVEGSEVTSSERKDSEIYFLSLNPDFPVDKIGRKRWDVLVEKHGAPTNSKSQPSSNAPVLSDKLLNVTIHPPPPASPLPLRLLPTMPLRTLKLKLQKTIGIKAASMRLFGKEAEGATEWEGDRRELSDLGVEEGGEIWVRSD